ncbi:MAG: hypothetical protein Q9226_009033, partial [Calogaya cf. arnoldii]
MRFLSFLSVSAILGFSVASSIHRKHEEIHNKRHEDLFERRTSETSANSSCGCTTIWSTIYGEPTLIQLSEYGRMPAPSSSSTKTTVHQVTHAPEIATSAPSPAHDAPAHPPKPAVFAEPPHPDAAKPTKPAEKPAETPIEKPAEKPAEKEEAASKNPSHNSSFPTNHSGSHWAMTYSPYTPSGDCKSSSSVATDVAAIASKGFSSLRLYSTDCNGLSTVATTAQSHNLNLILGVYISATGIPSARPQIHEIITWSHKNPAQWKNVEMIVVGNEAVFNNFASPSSLADFVSEARSAFKNAGYEGPVTLTETVDILSQHAEILCPISDIAAANIHPFFNGK